VKSPKPRILKKALKIPYLKIKLPKLERGRPNILKDFGGTNKRIIRRVKKEGFKINQ